ncbi:alkaline phosphatase family protein, partial [Pseudomonas aeruginosa]
ILAHLGALPAAGQYDLAGASLFEAVALRRASSRTSMDNKSVSLNWTRVGTPTGEIVITRDGKEIARLPGTATDYVDTGFTFTTEGLHELNYAI